MANASFVRAAQLSWLPLNKPLTNVTGWSVVIALPSMIMVCDCVRTPVQLYLLASVYRVYGLLVSAYLSMGLPHRNDFSSLNDFWHYRGPTNFVSFLVSCVNGLEISANLGTNFL